MKEQLVQSLEEARSRTLLLTDLFTDEELNSACCDYLSPPVWDLGHMANFEERWLIQHLAEQQELREGFNGIYNASENPRHKRPDLPLLNREGAKAYLLEVRSRVLDALEAGSDIPMGGFLHQMLANHEGQHQETLLQSMQFRGPREVAAQALPSESHPPKWINLPSGTFQMGTDHSVGKYDNEAPPHTVKVSGFEMASSPVTIGEYQEFVVSGGYGEEALWSERGWAWVQEHDAKRPFYWTEDSRTAITGVKSLSDASHEILCHITYYEAEAYASWRGARLPTETEWEYAAQGSAVGNVDQLGFQTSNAGAYPENPQGIRHMLGDVWEWTSSNFEAYPGFQAYPYKEYSEVFFGGDYKVLRGGSWATRPNLATATFRNWDHPFRAQIFSGIRLAR